MGIPKNDKIFKYLILLRGLNQIFTLKDDDAYDSARHDKTEQYSKHLLKLESPSPSIAENSGSSTPFH